MAKLKTLDECFEIARPLILSTATGLIQDKVLNNAAFGLGFHENEDGQRDSSRVSVTYYVPAEHHLNNRQLADVVVDRVTGEVEWLLHPRDAI